MRPKATESFSTYLKLARTSAGFTQSDLARRSSVSRTQIVKMEAGTYAPSFDEIVRLAEVLKIPLQRLLSGRRRPSATLPGIAFELDDLGLHDLEVSGAEVPGAFRHPEEVIVLALRGDRPEPRIVDAMPAILATIEFRVRLVHAFAGIYDPRVRTRLAWLSDVTLTLGRQSTFPVAVRTEAVLAKFVRTGKRAALPDSLGHPGEKRSPLLWRRWNITYAGDLENFSRRAQEVAAIRREAPGVGE